MVYYALVESHLTYGLIAWGVADDIYMNELAVLQRRILKAIMSRKSDYPFDLLYRELEVLDIRLLYILKIHNMTIIREIGTHVS